MVCACAYVVCWVFGGGGWEVGGGVVAMGRMFRCLGVGGGVGLEGTVSSNNSHYFQSLPIFAAISHLSFSYSSSCVQSNGSGFRFISVLSQILILVCEQGHNPKL